METHASHTSGIVVVKIGSSTLTTSESSIDYAFIDALADQIASVRELGFSPIIVTSAAIACGLEALGIHKRPTDMPSLQAAASVGQSALSTAYAEAFARRGMLTSTVLLTRRDTADRTAYLHARDTLHRLVDLGVVPIVNENDTVSVEQIRFGDNDTLAALTAVLVGAGLVVILSDIDGLYDANPATHADAKLLSKVEVIGPEVIAMAGGVGSAVGSGGMVTKIKAAQVLMVAGIPMAICQGRRPNVIVDAVRGCDVGTLFSPRRSPHDVSPKKLWLALGDATRGSLVVDAGARRALVERGSSLLVVGVSEVEGRFEEGDIVDIKDASGHVFARGRVRAGSDEIELGLGRTRDYLRANHLLSHLADRSLVHRDELVVFE
ncbi:glutamate 5-kinase [Xiamenia xianingshaonis]|uniref:Glutamate 5-kinase n=1 Tax=Xiamenia xianingshaonis TaxID=2682776 RepID=A0A9E6SU06_9ACTN|nr:glutamate 5-kinase [Xiamenia xianingshaonis]NGM17013.1 glutamate 5-kinase [Eggerthellaceae bacterium zg-893]NHM14507.1 glutamate 5-kinase [Xiamenia xianingshaonis]NHM15544.1 glutamate 5-kinase [Xiamenia xianingshaonis]QTU83797.1 glutamate 5-kinase [Xiamenia xianingshaonis]